MRTNMHYALPCVSDLRGLRDNPLKFLEQARVELGDFFVLHKHRSILSHADAARTIAVFGLENIRAVLSDIDLYGIPQSGARRLSMPSQLINLNFSLHALSGEEQRRHLRLLFQVLNEGTIEELRPRLQRALECYGQTWHSGKEIGLLSAMRELTSRLAFCLLFDSHLDGNAALPLLLQTYFQLRRKATAPYSRPGHTSRQELIIIGEAVDAALRRRVQQARDASSLQPQGILGRMVDRRSSAALDFSDDEIVGHLNVMFISISEPVAVALTWTLLILSQLPKLRNAITLELRRADSLTTGLVPPLLDSVIKESLRVLPPNAVMVRVSSRAAMLGKWHLPSRTEIVLCPFLAHREPGPFPRPSVFLPSRWETIRPSPFEYHPFGAGGHLCAGRYLAIHVIKMALLFLLSRFDLVLREDQMIDWRMDIILTPRVEPIMQVRTTTDRMLAGGKLCGPVSDLFDLNC